MTILTLREKLAYTFVTKAANVHSAIVHGTAVHYRAKIVHSVACIVLRLRVQYDYLGLMIFGTKSFKLVLLLYCVYTTNHPFKLSGPQTKNISGCKFTET